MKLKAYSQISSREIPMGVEGKVRTKAGITADIMAGTPADITIIVMENISITREGITEETTEETTAGITGNITDITKIMTAIMADTMAGTAEIMVGIMALIDRFEVRLGWLDP